jgi:LuxR family transcriptional regulator, maltose regulon positive regulatory protein
VAVCQRSFLDEGPALHALLAAMPEGHGEALARLRAAAAREPAGPGAETLPATGGESLLKAREMEILELAADERSNREIAARLALSENTVKWHWQQIFARLGVRRRGMAVRRARELGLLP